MWPHWEYIYMDVCGLKVSSLIHLLRESQERSVGYLGAQVSNAHLLWWVDKEMVWSAVGWMNNKRRGLDLTEGVWQLYGHTNAFPAHSSTLYWRQAGQSRRDGRYSLGAALCQPIPHWTGYHHHDDRFWKISKWQGSRSSPRFAGDARFPPPPRSRIAWW